MKQYIRCTKPYEKILGYGSYGKIHRGTGYSRPHISRVLRGIRGGSVDCLGRISEVTGVDMGILIKYIASRKVERLLKERGVEDNDA